MIFQCWMEYQANTLACVWFAALRMKGSRIAAMDPKQPLPQAVRDLAHRVCASAHGGPHSGDVRLTQKGRMRQDATSGWMHFTARQTISTTSCAFDWRARTGPAGTISIRDALVGGEGVLDVRALGFIPVAHMGGSPDATRGELMRYLAELPLAPAAILGNPSLRWRSDTAVRLIVSAGSGDTAAEVTFTLGTDGRVASVFAPDRPRAVKNTFVPAPWQGRFSDYRQHRGFWLPFAAEVSWPVNGADSIYWQGQMQSWTDDQPRA